MLKVMRWIKKLKSAENTIKDEVIILLYHFSKNVIITHDTFYFNCELLGKSQEN